MKNKKLMQMLIVGVSIFALAGCGTSNDMGTNRERETKDAYIENDITNPDKKDAPNENDSKDTSNENNSKETPDEDNPKNTPDENNPKNTPDENNSKNTSDGNNSNAVGSINYLQVPLLVLKSACYCHSIPWINSHESPRSNFNI